MRDNSVCLIVFGLIIQGNIFRLRQLRSEGQLIRGIQKNIRTEHQKAIFLDRDGTVCEESNYLSSAADLRVFPFAAEAIKSLQDKGFLVILVTNQSGIGRGFFGERALAEIHEKLAAELALEDAKLDAIYFCPHISEERCACRKPKAGMIFAAARDFRIDLKNSWMIGDKAVDVATGRAAGTKTALVLTGYGHNEIEIVRDKADLIGENLLEIAGMIENNF